MFHIIDNFYSSPEKLLRLSDSCLNTGCGSGIRSDDISLLDTESYYDLKNFLFSQYNIDYNNHHLTSYLTKQTYQAENSGRIHIDGRNPNSCDIVKSQYKLVLCGMIFLTPSLDTNSGISFYEVNDNVWSDEEEFNVTLNDCYTYNEEQLDKYHDNFYETLSVKNIQNRFVCWTAGSKHKNNITEKQGTRIVQNFYISMV